MQLMEPNMTEENVTIDTLIKKTRGFAEDLIRIVQFLPSLRIAVESLNKTYRTASTPSVSLCRRGRVEFKLAMESQDVLEEKLESSLVPFLSTQDESGRTYESYIQNVACHRIWIFHVPEPGTRLLQSPSSHILLGIRYAPEDGYAIDFNAKSRKYAYFIMIAGDFDQHERIFISAGLENLKDKQYFRNGISYAEEENITTSWNDVKNRETDEMEALGETSPYKALQMISCLAGSLGREEAKVACRDPRLGELIRYDGVPFLIRFGEKTR